MVAAGMVHESSLAGSEVAYRNYKRDSRVHACSPSGNGPGQCKQYSHVQGINAGLPLEAQSCKPGAASFGPLSEQWTS